MKRFKLGVIALSMSSMAWAAPLDFGFKSPSFNGIGYSSHVLTIENQEHSRSKERADAIQAALDKAAADAKNTNIAKFMNNLESRIYAQISQNVATAMFANGNCKTTSDPCAGDFAMEKDANGNTLTGISWYKSGSDIILTVKQPGVSDTQITVPLAQFQIPGL